MKKFFITLVCGAFLFTIIPNAYADKRRYVWTYEYMTMPKGMFEVEYYFTHAQPKTSNYKPNTQKHYVELEYGITNHWDIALYQRFKQSNRTDNSSFEYDGSKIRSRYRFLEKGSLPVDTLIYLEYIIGDDSGDPHVLENKLILAKDIGNFNIVYNVIVKQALEPSGKTEHEYATGISYSLKPNLKIGIESKGNYSDRKYYAGPTISWSINKFWVALGVTAGLNNKSDDMQARLIIGIPF